MSRGIIIFGPVGSGKTTLGRMVAQELGFPYFDIDDYICRWDTPVPFTVMRTREEKISGLMNAIAPGNWRSSAIAFCRRRHVRSASAVSRFCRQL